MNGERADMVLSDPPYGMKLDTDFSSIKGSLNSIGRKNHTEGNKYERVRYGKSHIAELLNPRTRDKWTEHEWAVKRHFGEAQAEAARIYKDPVLYAPYKEKFKNQTLEGNLLLTGKRKLYVKEDSYLLACVLKERKDATGAIP